jgi:hypothetical protein
MRHTLFFISAFCIFALASSTFLTAQTIPQQGTIIRMRMTDCLGPQHAFMAVMAGGDKGAIGESCPEYVLVGDKVVYVISGKSSEQLMPLAEITRFRLQKNEMLIRIQDAPKESHFHLKAMVLRPDWEHNQILEEAAANAMISQHLDSAALRGQQ